MTTPSSRRRAGRVSKPLPTEQAAQGSGDLDGASRDGEEVKNRKADRTLKSLKQTLANRTAEVEQKTRELARLEHLLSDQRQMLQAVFENTSDAIFVTDLEGRPLMTNPAAIAMVGPIPADVTLNRCQERYGVYRTDRVTAFPVEQMPIVRAMRENAVVEGEAFLKHSTRPGGTWISGLASPLRDATGAVVGGVVNVRDVTERKQAEEAIRESEARLRAIVETASDGIITIDETSIIESCNPASERMFGYPSHAMIGHSISMLMPSPYREEFKAALANFQHSTKSPPVAMSRELIARRHDGSTLPIELSISRFRHGKNSLFTTIIRDISERRAFEEKLLSIAEEEQRRIGQDLHDDIGQELTGLALKAETLAEMLGEDHTLGPGLALATGIVTALDRTRGKVRLLARGMVPVEIDSKGLTLALKELTSRLGEANKVACVFECSVPSGVADGRVATHLYHIAQEAITNAIKHGQARKIRVSLQTRRNGTRLEIKDDGKGFQQRQGQGAGTGMQIMAYRASLIRGELTVRPVKPRGTAVTCLLLRGTENGLDLHANGEN